MPRPLVNAWSPALCAFPRPRRRPRGVWDVSYLLASSLCSRVDLGTSSDSLSSRDAGIICCVSPFALARCRVPRVVPLPVQCGHLVFRVRVCACVHRCLAHAAGTRARAARSTPRQPSKARRHLHSGCSHRCLERDHCWRAAAALYATATLACRAPFRLRVIPSFSRRNAVCGRWQPTTFLCKETLLVRHESNFCWTRASPDRMRSAESDAVHR